MSDLNPPVTEQDIGGLRLLSDHDLESGTKQRGAAEFMNLLKSRGVKTIVFTGSTNGFGQIAAAKACSLANVEIYILIFMKPTELTLRAVGYGAKLISIYLDKGKLFYSSYNRAETLAKLLPGKRQFLGNFAGDRIHTYNYRLILLKFAQQAKLVDYKVLDLGLDDDEYIACLARGLQTSLENIKQPSNIWMVVGSMTILRAMAKVWKETTFHCVRVGKVAELIPGINMKIYDATKKYRFTEDVRGEDVPPFPALLDYDAKVWLFRRLMKTGDAIWIVA